jgi:uncharacterized protein YggE
MRSLRRTLLVAALVLAATAFAGVAEPRLAHTASTDTTPPTAAPRTITVTGSGSTNAVPDRASFQFGVDTQADTAKDALARNASAAAAVIAALKAAGVDSADLQTVGVSLSTRTTPDGNTIVGYTASNSVSATVSLAKAGGLVDAAVAAGAGSVSGPSLDTSDHDALYRKALEQAVADAQAKAQVLATAAGLQLGAVQTMQEGAAAQPLRYASPTAFGAAASTPIEPGTQEIDATVTVTYAVTG